MKNKTEPLLFRPHKGDCELYLPYDRSNRARLKRCIGSRSDLTFDKQRQTWSFKRTHFAEVRDMINKYYRLGTVIVDIVKRGQCDTRCVKARGDECSCECGGDNHGGLRGGDKWVLVGETTLVTNEVKVNRRTYRVGTSRSRE
ncbi:hypothetical protein [Nocardiopsis alba]|uniref:hypothetical protein n=1 Tax=Nocardiopsis alba TaxID=53437 RepID=UPI0011D20CA9|nr:hypothetical protein [Nocardiopsis alba]